MLDLFHEHPFFELSIDGAEFVHEVSFPFRLHVPHLSLIDTAVLEANGALRILVELSFGEFGDEFFTAYFEYSTAFWFIIEPFSIVI